MADQPPQPTESSPILLETKEQIDAYRKGIRERLVEVTKAHAEGVKARDAYIEEWRQKVLSLRDPLDKAIFRLESFEKLISDSRKRHTLGREMTERHIERLRKLVTTEEESFVYAQKKKMDEANVAVKEWEEKNLAPLWRVLMDVQKEYAGLEELEMLLHEQG